MTLDLVSKTVRSWFISCVVSIQVYLNVWIFHSKRLQTIALYEILVWSVTQCLFCYHTTEAQTWWCQWIYLRCVTWNYCTPSQQSRQIAPTGSKAHGANMGSIWGREDPGESHVDLMNFAIWDALAAADQTPYLAWSTVCMTLII